VASFNRLFVANCLLFLVAALHAQTAHYSGAQSTLPSNATYPFGVAVDAGGNVWVVDNFSGVATEVTPSGASYTGPSAVLGGFNGPYGIAIDTHGNIYITEDGVGQPVNDVIKETYDGGAYTPSILPTSGLDSPQGIAVDTYGNVYIADTYNGRVVKETPLGNSYIQSTVSTSSSGEPTWVAVDAGGNLYITDALNSQVLKEKVSGNGYTESIVVDQLPRSPQEVSVDGQGNVYVLMYTPGGYGEDFIALKATPSGNGYTQSTVNFAPYQNPYGMAVDASGNIFIASPGSNRLEKLVPGAGDFGLVNAGSTSSRISLIFTMDTAGTLGIPAVVTDGLSGLDFANAGSGSCGTQGNGYVYGAGTACSIDVVLEPQFAAIRHGAAIVRDVAGNPLASAYVYGTGAAAQMSFLPARQVLIDHGLADPLGVAVDAQGSVFLAESGSGTVYKEMRSGNSYQRTAVARGLSDPTAVAIDGKGNLYVAATNTIYKETLTAGSYLQSAIITGVAEPADIALDGSGNLYITSAASGDVHKETLEPNGGYSESGIGYGITHPGGLAVDGHGNVFVTDPQQGEVYKETLAANGSYLQSTLGAGVVSPESLAVDGGGNVYVIASTGGQLYKEALQPSGAYVQSILAGGLDGPRGIALDAQGNLYLSLDFSGQLIKIDVSDPPVLSFAATAVGSTSADSPELLTIANIGNGALDFPAVGAGVNPTLSSGFRLASATTCPEVDSSGPDAGLNPGASCVYAVDYTPVSPGPIRGSLQLTDSNLNAAWPYWTQQTFELRQGITSDATQTTVSVNPPQVNVGAGITITATVTDTSTLSIIPQGAGVTFTQTLNGVVTELHGGAPVPLVNGQATLNLTLKVAGQYTITANYGGVSASFASSTGVAPLSVFRKPGA
jgi:sugar lactone lactonase YvrE